MVNLHANPEKKEKQMENTLYRTLRINQLIANYATTSQNKCGFFLCRQGEGDVLFNNRSYHIERGVLCLYTPYTFIRIVRRSDDLDGYLLEGETDTVQSVLSSIPVMNRLSIRTHPCIRMNPEQCQRFEQAVEMLHSRTELMCRAKKPQSVRLLYQLVQTLLQAFCLEVLEIYFDSVPVEELPQNREEKIFNRFFMSVYRNCLKERSVLFYADEQHLSPNYLSSVVKAKSGRTAIQWIETITMIHAQHYLGSTQLSIKEVAEKMHFPDQSTFGRYFKKHSGVSPSEYRKGPGE